MASPQRGCKLFATCFAQLLKNVSKQEPATASSLPLGSEKRVKAAASYSRGYITMAETIVPLENHTGLRAGDGPG